LPTIKELSKRSRICQKGAWGGSITLFILSISILLTLGILNAIVQLLFERPQVSGVLFAFWPPLSGIASACLAIGLLLCALFILAPLRMGQRAWYYGGAIRPTRSGKWVTFWYKPSQMFHAAHISISMGTRKMAWALFLLSPGILLSAGALYISARDGLETRLFMVLLGGSSLLMACGFIAWLWIIQRYALVPWIAARYPKMSVKKAIAASMERMEGQYGFSLSLGMRLLLFTPLALLGLPLLWIVPYAMQRRAVWAFSLVER